MQTPAPDPQPHDFIDAEISVAGLKTPADEEALRIVLGKLDGIESLSVSDGKVVVEYDPLRVTKAEIGQAIVGAGFGVAEVESAPASAITDALHGE